MRIYITNLQSEVTDDDLKKLFESHGNVIAVEITKSLTESDSTGLGYVEMKSPADDIAVRKELDGKILRGSPIKIYDRRNTSDRREGADRRVLNVRQDLSDRRQMVRRTGLERRQIGV